MPTDQTAGVIPRLRRAALLADGGDLTDGRLLECFVARRDEAAFEALVRRHAAMVLGVCRRVVGDAHDAEDAFQATFLVLVRKAASVQPREAVGHWLYGVAYRTALEARARNARRRAREKQVKDVPQPAVEPEQVWRELRPILDQELSRLPEKYRLPVVLCDLEGRGRKEVSRQFQMAEGTLSSRLARGRKMLAQRLTRRGVVLTAGALALTLAHNAASAGAPAPLVISTVKAASLVAAGQAATGVFSAKVAALAKGVLKAMLLNQLKSATTALLIVALVGTGAGLLIRGGIAGQSAASERPIAAGASAEQACDGRTADPSRPPAPAATISGTVVGIAGDGKTITVETAAAGRGAEAKRADVKLTDKTEVLYNSVGPGGAKLTEGYYVQVWPAEGTTDVAARLQLTGKDGARRAPDVSGPVESVSNDGKTLTFRMQPQGRGEDGKAVDVHVNDKTALLYSYIAKGGTKPTAGYRASVYYKWGSNDTAAKVDFMGAEHLPERGAVEKAPDADGTVGGARDDGKVVGVEIVSDGRRDPPVRQEYQLDDKTQVTYLNVGPDGDKPTAGYHVQVWLADGSKDTAGKMVFRADHKETGIVTGKIFTVSKDDKTITLDVPPQTREEAPKQVEIKLTDKTHVIYENVGPAGATLTAGYAVRVWLEEDSTDTAVQVVLSPPGERGR